MNIAGMRWSVAGVASAALCVLALGCGGTSQEPTEPTGPTITGVKVTPNSPTVTIGTTAQFSASVSGTGSYNTAVNWSVAGPSNWTGSVGSISASGLYETPYPAPTSVTVTATAAGDTTQYRHRDGDAAASGGGGRTGADGGRRQPDPCH